MTSGYIYQQELGLNQNNQASRDGRFSLERKSLKKIWTYIVIWMTIQIIMKIIISALSA